MNSFTATPQNLPPLQLWRDIGCVTADPATPGQSVFGLGGGWFYPDNGPTVYRDSAGTTPIKLSTQASGTTVYSNATTLGSAPASVDSLPATTWSSLEGSASCPLRIRRSSAPTS